MDHAEARSTEDQVGLHVKLLLFGRKAYRLEPVAWGS
jgi:hypothetical protein